LQTRAIVSFISLAVTVSEHVSRASRRCVDEIGFAKASMTPSRIRCVLAKVAKGAFESEMDARPIA
jgi:hypothetical protein